MLEKYFVRPATIDRIRASWIGSPIEKYVEWLAAREYAPRSILHRVPILLRFGEFAAGRGAKSWEELPSHVGAFVDLWVGRHVRRYRRRKAGEWVTKEARGPVEQMLSVILPDFVGTGRPRRSRPPFDTQVPDFFDYLESERGLRPATVKHYRHYLIRLETYLGQVGISDLGDLSLAIVGAFVAERRAAGLALTSIRDLCGVLRVFLRYLHRENVLATNLSAHVEWPQAYRLATVPRSVSWNDVAKVLEAADRRTPIGKRDYAILLLLVTYGLRSREIAALVLDDIDWKRERLRIPERKAGHSTAFPLSTVVGEALVDYLRHGRPKTSDRHVFFRAVAPYEPITSAAVSSRAGHYLRQSGVQVPRPGSHTLRHTCVQRLVDAGFPLKHIGDYVGHRSPASTEIYGKVAVDALRHVALGDGEEVL